MNSWTFTPEEEASAKIVLDTFTNEKGFVLYDKLRTESPDLYKKLSNNRGHIQLQQAFSKYRIKMGRKLNNYGGTTKRSYVKRAKIQPKNLPEIRIAQKRRVDFCPCCGVSLKEVEVAINMRD